MQEKQGKGMMKGKARVWSYFRKSECGKTSLVRQGMHRYLVDIRVEALWLSEGRWFLFHFWGGIYPKHITALKSQMSYCLAFNSIQRLPLCFQNKREASKLSLKHLWHMDWSTPKRINFPNKNRGIAVLTG